MVDIFFIFVIAHESIGAIIGIINIVGTSISWTVFSLVRFSVVFNVVFADLMVGVIVVIVVGVYIWDFNRDNSLGKIISFLLGCSMTY